MEDNSSTIVGLGLTPDFQLNGFDGCGFTTVPKALDQLRQLQYLDLSGNRIQAQTFAANFTALAFLGLSNNELTALPSTVYCGAAKSIGQLYASGNRLRTLPDCVGEFTQLLLELDVSDNQLESLPDSIGNLTQLQTLTLHSNRLLSLPDSIGNLTQLQTLTLQSNVLLSLPESIGHLTQLQTLTLQKNFLQSLPESIGDLTQLQDLELNVNLIQRLPRTLGK
eukprot:SAG31_NODE_1620_length_7725_cov_1.520850_2_plen_223_part_00